jgi:hypothetical protein
MEGRDGRTLDLIRAAVRAGGYSRYVREHPDSPGLRKLWAGWDERVTALASELAGRALAARPHRL